MYEEKSWLKSCGIFAVFGLVPLSIFIVVEIIPFLMGAVLTFTDWTSATKEFHFIGFTNYITLFKDETFWASLKITFFYVVFVIVFTNIIAYMLAELITSGFRGQNLCRAGYFTPNLIGGVVLGFIWQFVFSRVLPYIGVLLGIGVFEKSWIASPKYALYALIIVSVWQNAGYMMLVFIAGIMSLDRFLLEAASIDGASKLKTLLWIKLPLMVPAFTITMFLTLKRAFMMFDINLSLTKGGPYNSTELISMHIYNEMFLNQNLGIGRAKGIILFVIVAIISVLQVGLLKRKEVEAL